MQKEHLQQQLQLQNTEDPIEDEVPSDSEDEGNIKFAEKYIIERGTKVEVPFWLATICGIQGYVEVEVPRVFTDLNYVTSNFEKAALSKVNRYFYDFGSALFKLMAEIASELKQDQELQSLYSERRATIIQTLVHRFKLFLKQAYVASHEKVASSWLTEQYTTFKAKLCNTELAILQMIQSDETNFVEWKHKSLGTYKLQYGEKNYIASTNSKDGDEDEDDTVNGDKRRRKN